MWHQVIIIKNILIFTKTSSLFQSKFFQNFIIRLALNIFTLPKTPRKSLINASLKLLCSNIKLTKNSAAAKNKTIKTNPMHLSRKFM